MKKPAVFSAVRGKLRPAGRCLREGFSGRNAAQHGFILNHPFAGLAVFKAVKFRPKNARKNPAGGLLLKIRPILAKYLLENTHPVYNSIV